MATANDDITSAQAAEIIGVSASQVTRYAKSGALKHTWHGSQLVIKRRDAKKFQRPPRGNPRLFAKRK